MENNNTQKTQMKLSVKGPKKPGMIRIKCHGMVHRFIDMVPKWQGYNDDEWDSEGWFFANISVLPECYTILIACPNNPNLYATINFLHDPRDFDADGICLLPPGNPDLACEYGVDPSQYMFFMSKPEGVAFCTIAYGQQIACVPW